MITELIPQAPGNPYPLGRHRVHDPLSRGFDAADWLVGIGIPTKPVTHQRNAPVWDQGRIGSCTAHAAAGMLVTGRFATLGLSFTEQQIIDLYSEETRIDDRAIPGRYPPDDTGSAGIYSMKVLRAHKWISGYRHAFSLRSALATLALYPVSIGIGWYDSMFAPDPSGLVTISPSASIAGGHQIVFDAIDPTQNRARFCNSWGSSWGANGWGWMTWDTLDQLLSEGGDVSVGVL